MSDRNLLVRGVQAYINGLPRDARGLFRETMQGVIGAGIWMRIILHVLVYSAASKHEPSDIHPLEVNYGLTAACAVERDAMGNEPSSDMDWLLRCVTAALGCFIAAGILGWRPLETPKEMGAFLLWTLQSGYLILDPIIGIAVGRLNTRRDDHVPDGEPS